MDVFIYYKIFIALGCPSLLGIYVAAYVLTVTPWNDKQQIPCIVLLSLSLYSGGGKSLTVMLILPRMFS